MLDEPTAALGVKQAGIVLRYIVMAKKRGLAVIFITHNPNHAYPVGDYFVILRRSGVEGDLRKDELPLEGLMRMKAVSDLRHLVDELGAGRDGARHEEEVEELRGDRVA